MKRIFTYTLLTLAFFSCRQMIDLDQNPPIDESETVVDLVVNRTAPGKEWNEATRSYELTPDEEQKIKSIEFLVFNSAGSLVSRERIFDPASYSYRIKTKSGTNMSIYVVTNATLTINASGSPIDVLGQVTTLADLKNIKITNITGDVTANRTMVMYGLLENVTIAPYSGTGPATPVMINLNYVAAKITVNLYSALPAGETFTLLDWKIGSLARYSYIFPRGTDVVDPAVANDFVTQGSTNAWSDTTLVISGTPYPAKTTTFYLFENRRGTNGNTLAADKSGASAPIGATKLIANGFYKTASAVTGVKINLMFGANSINDYNIERTKRYVYTVKVSGINNIVVDTRFDDSGIGFLAEVSNSTLDAHYDFRPLRITAFKGSSKVTILDEVGVPTDADVGFWLNVSSLNITQFVDDGAGNYVRPRYDPVSLVQESTITHSAASEMEVQWMYLYADEFLTDNGVRTATVRVVHTPFGGNALPPIDITITQRGILLAGNVGMRVTNAAGTTTTTNYKLGTEIIEEATLSITPGNSAAERTMTMQWGFDGTMMLPLGNYSLRNGFENTRTLVMSNTTTGTLRTPYGRSGSSLISHQAYNPIYNTYAARYCFEKNRDTDGNGVIVGPEVKWYLPSINEQLLINAGNASWSTNVADIWSPSLIYTSSSQYTTITHVASVYSSGNTGITSNSRLENVRCVRQL